MTPTRYAIARIAQAFGYFRKGNRMSDAASEMHLLREAEAYLGFAIWERVENIDALSVEYWNLRKLVKERDAIRARLEECQRRLNLAHEERASLLSATPETNQELHDERLALLAELEQLAVKRDHIVAEAREVRRTFTGMRTKLEVLTEETAAGTDRRADIAGVKTRLVELKQRFDDLKNQRQDIADLIEQGDAKLDLVDEKLREQRQVRRVQASGAFQIIGEGNKEISLLRAESGVIDTQMRQLFAEIGRYVSRHAKQDPACAVAAITHHGLIDVMRALRRSIALNHKLAGTS
jgi:chromosome segregation ATPase